MIELNLSQDFPASLDRLWAAFGREDYPRRKYLALGAAAVRIGRFSATAQAIDVALERDVPVDPKLLPAWARALVGGRQTLRQHSTWHRAGPTTATADLHIVPVGLPVRADGRGTIDEISPRRSRMLLNWRVDSHWPAIGHAIEQMFAEQIRRSLDADHVFTLRYLADGRSPPKPRT